MKILITGASGCVGRYLVEALLANPDHRLVLAVREAAKLDVLSDADRARVEIVECDLTELAARPEAFDGVEAGVLVATAWGGGDTYDITVGANLAIADALIAAGARHVLYFATASVLDQQGGLLQAADTFGTDYIRAKFQLVQQMETRADRARITGLYPTLVMGGRTAAPAIRMSHFANLMHEIRPYAWALRFISANGLFNIVHAADIATVTRHLIETVTDTTGNARLVLGNPAGSVDEMMAQFARANGRRQRTILRLHTSWVDTLTRVLPINLSPWDRFCVDHPDQSHPAAVNPATYGLPVVMPDLVSGLASIGISGRG